jgi:hypothetical protein
MADGTINTADAATGTDGTVTPPAITMDQVLASAPEDVRSYEKLKGFKDTASFVKAFVDTDKYNTGAIKLPTDTSKPEEWERVYSKLGRPDKPEGYNFKKPDNLPNGVEWNDEFEKDFRSLAHKNGLTNSQAQVMLDSWNTYVGKQAATIQTSRESGEAELKKVWGAEYEKNVTLCQRAVKELGDEEFVKFLDTSTYGNHPAMVKFLAKIGAELAEDSSAAGAQATSSAIGAREARAEIAKIRTDKSHPYHTGNKEAVERMQELYIAAHSELTE